MAAFLDTALPHAATPRNSVDRRTERWRNPHTGTLLRIGLVNNMPDGALVATERQFSGLVEIATGGQVRLELYYLPTLARGENARAVLSARYLPISALFRNGIDALIITGNEPRAARLDEEPYWKELTRLIDWARGNTTTTLFSCLAAHAAVLHLDGVERRRLPKKRSGVYACKVASRRDAGLPDTLTICHSRLNEVPKRELLASGYHVISEQDGAQVDAFSKRLGSEFLFLQGHPEYDPESLLKEYRRDVGRFLNRQRVDYPELPANYFDAASVRDYENFRALAESRPLPSLAESFPHGTLRRGLSERLAQSANAMMGYWLESLVAAVRA